MLAEGTVQGQDRRISGLASGMIVTRPIPPPLAQVTIACVESWAESEPGYCNCSWARLLKANELSLRVGGALVRSSFSRTTPLIFVVTRDECYDWRHERGSQPASQVHVSLREGGCWRGDQARHPIPMSH